MESCSPLYRVLLNGAAHSQEWRHESRPAKFHKTNTSSSHHTLVQRSHAANKFKNLGTLYADQLSSGLNRAVDDSIIARDNRLNLASLKLLVNIGLPVSIEGSIVKVDEASFGIVQVEESIHGFCTGTGALESAALTVFQDVEGDCCVRQRSQGKATSQSQERNGFKRADVRRTHGQRHDEHEVQLKRRQRRRSERCH